jgi:hypothetical protein
MFMCELDVWFLVLGGGRGLGGWAGKPLFSRMLVIVEVSVL